MNPLFQALTGGMGAQAPMSGPSGIPGGGMGGMNGIFGKVQQLAGMFQNPQQMVAKFFPDAPQEAAGDPNSLLQWMQQTGKVHPQMVQMARQMMGGH